MGGRSCLLLLCALGLLHVCVILEGPHFVVLCVCCCYHVHVLYLVVLLFNLLLMVFVCLLVCLFVCLFFYFLMCVLFGGRKKRGESLLLLLCALGLLIVRVFLE